MYIVLTGKSILITGGTGTLGKALTKEIFKRYPGVRRLVIFSRDELKQFEMSQEISVKKYPAIRYFLGDIRDFSRVRRALEGVDYVIHAAALKQVPAAEYNPSEFIKTNIMGAQKYGKLKVLLKENTQIVLSPGPVVFELRRLLKDYNSNDYLLLSGDPSVIGLACAIASDINNGRFNLLKWDRQEKVYYPLEINLYEKGKIDE